MAYYFRLQATMLQRHLIDFGLPPIAGVLLAMLLFVGGSAYVFRSYELANYLYGTWAVFSVFRLSDTERNRFLKTCFSKSLYRQVRIVENGLVALPFVVFLLFFGYYMTAGTVAVTSGLLAIVNVQSGFSRSLPTPFGRQPFEFAVGFRQTILLVIGMYAVVAIAISVNNFNLCIVAASMAPMLGMFYYGNLEERFYVWIHAAEPSAFLCQKARTALRHSLYLSVLPAAACIAFFPAMWYVVPVVLLVTNLYLLMIVFGKYADFPNPINIGQSFLIGLSFIFPPLVLLLTPYFYIKARKSLITTLT